MFGCLRWRIHFWGDSEEREKLGRFSTSHGAEKQPREGVYLATLALVLLPILNSRFAHGGSLAAMMDETFSKTAYLAGEGLFTLSLNIRFKK